MYCTSAPAIVWWRTCFIEKVQYRLTAVAVPNRDRRSATLSGSDLLAVAMVEGTKVGVYSGASRQYLTLNTGKSSNTVRDAQLFVRNDVALHPQRALIMTVAQSSCGRLTKIRRQKCMQRSWRMYVWMENGEIVTARARLNSNILTSESNVLLTSPYGWSYSKILWTTCLNHLFKHLNNTHWYCLNSHD